MVSTPLLLLPRLVLLHGVFRHGVFRRVLPDATATADRALIELDVCETALPALFCTCGVYMLFVDDALPDDPPPPKESPLCPSGPVV